MDNMPNLIQMRRPSEEEVGRTAVIIVLVVIVAAGCVAWYRKGQLRQVERAELGINLVGNRGDFRPVQRVGKFPTWTDFPVVPVAAARDKLNPTELVLGVQLGDKARAYPINMLTGPSREILNDRLAGKSIAATW